jgi:hypothetical protein
MGTPGSLMSIGLVAVMVAGPALSASQFSRVLLIRPA